jgi:cell wall-associated NlpC family hydrolase
MLAVIGPSGLSSSQAAPSKEELDAAEDRLHELEEEFELVVEEYNLVNEQLDDIKSDISGAELVVDRLEKRMGGRQEDAVALAQEMYKGGGSVGGMEAVLSSQTLAEMDARLAYIESTEEANTEIFESLAADRSLLEDKLEELEEDRAAASKAEDRLVELRSEIDAKVASQEDEISELNAAIEAAAERREAREEAAEEAASEAAAEEAAAEAPSGGGGSGGDAPALASNPNPAPAPSGGASAAVSAAVSQVGKPYQWGAAGPNSYDCSGLTMWAWAHGGVSLPHNSGMQYSATTRISSSAVQPGDLLFYGSPIHHVSMYIGNGQMVEAPYTGSQVRVVPMRTSDLVGAGRV